MAKVRVREALNQALADELASDPSVILLGEDIAVAGGAFKVTEGLHDRYPDRVLDTPISEMAFLGAALGAAAMGLRPVVEMMFVEFTGVALDQLVTEAAKLRYLSRGELTAPLVLRASVGAGLGFGCQHSQVLDQWFRATPGLKLVTPSSAQSAYTLLRAAIRDPDPVVFLEPRALYARREEAELTFVAGTALGHAATVRVGTDVTVVTAGQMVPVVHEAAQAMADVSVEIVDLQTLVPWDLDAVLASVHRTHRLVVVEESHVSGGWGAEVCHEIGARLFGRLLAPPLRVTCPDVPVPYAEALEAAFLPSSRYVQKQIEYLVRTAELPPTWWDDELATPLSSGAEVLS